MFSTYKPPENPKNDQPEYDITAIDMNQAFLFAGQITDNKRQHQRPVENPDQRIPYIHSIIHHYHLQKNLNMEYLQVDNEEKQKNNHRTHD